jgi:hypothetical protein
MGYLLNLAVKVLSIISIENALMMDAVRTSETSVDNHFTRLYNPKTTLKMKISSFLLVSVLSEILLIKVL